MRTIALRHSVARRLCSLLGCSSRSVVAMLPVLLAGSEGVRSVSRSVLSIPRQRDLTVFATLAIAEMGDALSGQARGLLRTVRQAAWLVQRVIARISRPLSAGQNARNVPDMVESAHASTAESTVQSLTFRKVERVLTDLLPKSVRAGSAPSLLGTPRQTYVGPCASARKPETTPAFGLSWQRKLSYPLPGWRYLTVRSQRSASSRPKVSARASSGDQPSRKR